MRWLAVLALWTGPAVAQVWSGTYLCGQGRTALTLTVHPADEGRVTALFRFGADPSNPGVPNGCFAMSGTLEGRHLRLTAGEWLLQPFGYVTVDLDGLLTPNGRAISGRVAGPGCTSFTLERVKADPGIARCGGLVS